MSASHLMGRPCRPHTQTGALGREEGWQRGAAVDRLSQDAGRVHRGDGSKLGTPGHHVISCVRSELTYIWGTSVGQPRLSWQHDPLPWSLL